MLARAKASGVKAVIVVGYDLPSSLEAVELARRQPEVWAAVGIHPHDARTASDEVFGGLVALARDPRVVALGEVGLDYHYDHSPRPVQAQVFERQLAIARELDLPVIVHSREAEADTMAILRASGLPRAGAVMHCFPGGVELADQAAAMGLHIGITGVVTFPKSDEMRRVAAHASLERLLLETDAPYLAPVPHRGRTSEPAHVAVVAQAVAALRGMDLGDLAEVTTRNAERLFRRMVAA